MVEKKTPIGEKMKLICVHPQMIPTTNKISRDQNMRENFLIYQTFSDLSYLKIS